MRLVRPYFRSARRLSKPTEEAAADKCLEIGAAGPSILQLKAGYETILGRAGTNLSHLRNRPTRHWHAS
jgi:hypothetical protein